MRAGAIADARRCFAEWLRASLDPAVVREQRRAAPPIADETVGMVVARAEWVNAPCVVWYVGGLELHGPARPEWWCTLGLHDGLTVNGRWHLPI